MDIVRELILNKWFLALFPMIIWGILIVIISLLRVHRWRKIHLVAQGSALFFVAGTIYLIQEMYGIFLLSPILILGILFLAIHLIVQRWTKVDVSFSQAFILLLRLSFLIFFVAYLILLVLYIIRIFA